MTVRYSQYPKLSDWSMPQSDGLDNRDSPCSNNIEITDNSQHPTEDLHTKNSKTSRRPGKCCSSISPWLQGLLMGIGSNVLLLATVIVLWLVPQPKIGGIINNELPPGTIVLFGGNLSTLDGSTHRWLLCDGSAVSRVIYRDLFYVIGITYGPGNGNDTFNLPDFRARFPLGSSSNSGPLVAAGASSHTITVAELPTHFHDQGTLVTLSSGIHTHLYVDPGHDHGGSTSAGPYSSGSFSMIGIGGGGNDHGTHTHTIPNGTTNITIQADGIHTHTVQGLTGPQGSNQPINMMPPYQTIHYIIRA